MVFEGWSYEKELGIVGKDFHRFAEELWKEWSENLDVGGGGDRVIDHISINIINTQAVLIYNDMATNIILHLVYIVYIYLICLFV